MVIMTKLITKKVSTSGCISVSWTRSRVASALPRPMGYMATGRGVVRLSRR